MAALLHGQFRDALHWNMLEVLLLPILIVFLSHCYWRAMRSDKFVWPAPSQRWITASLVGVAVFTLYRNLHFF